MELNNRSFVVAIILLSMVILLLLCILMFFRSKYLHSQKRYTKLIKKQQENNLNNIINIDTNDENAKEVEKITRTPNKRQRSLEFSDYDGQVSELTASVCNGDLEEGQPKYSKDEYLEEGQPKYSTNDVDLTKPTYITKWKSKIHKTSKNAKLFIKRYLMNNNSDKSNNELLKNYERNDAKQSPSNFYEPTREAIIVPVTMLPDLTENGIIRFANSEKNDTIQYLTLNTSNLSRAKSTTHEEFKIQSVRIINSPR